jgi:phage gpG-like protein
MSEFAVLPIVDIGLEGAVEAEQELFSIADALGAIGVPLEESAVIARNDMKRRFDTETDPDGDQWVALDPEYLASKISLGYPADILRRTEGFPLETAATNPEAFKVVGDSVYFDTSGLPFYGLYHQTGSGTENVGNARDYRERFAAMKSAGATSKGESAHDSMGIGRGMALPRRAFIGLSQDAEVEVIAVFDKWFEEATHTGFDFVEEEYHYTPPPASSSTTRDFSDPTKFYVRPSGTVQQRIGGRFGPKVG